MQNEFTNKILDAGTTTLVNSIRKTMENPDFLQSTFGKVVTAGAAGVAGGIVGAYIYEKYINPNKVTQNDLAELKLLIQQNTLQNQKLQFQQQAQPQQQAWSQNNANQANSQVIDVTPENIEKM